MSNLDALYQEIILDHNRRPRNYGELAGADRTVAGRNPLCGDEMTLWVRVENDRIAEAKFVAQGCAVSKASASLMTTAVKGKTREEAGRLFERVHKLVTGKLSEDERTGMGPLAALGGVSKFPIRVKCASLPWHALKKALDESAANEPVTTE
ncbi:MAG: SUF system NifU family Fe-S cluster assembly protein [Gemmatimonadota bacterium]|nr:SUF system NifU family Fe-S cluster assembly protein [Gemmatimonadota bacterium]